MKTIWLFIGVISWFPLGYLIAKFKVDMWYLIFIKNQNAKNSEIKNWNKYHLLIMYFIAPSQFSIWFFDKNHLKTCDVIPIIPSSLFTTTACRSETNSFFLHNRDLDFFQRQVDLIQFWYINIIVLGWINIVFWALEFVMVTCINLFFEVIICLIFCQYMIGKKFLKS